MPLLVLGETFVVLGRTPVVIGSAIVVLRKSLLVLGRKLPEFGRPGLVSGRMFVLWRSLVTGRAPLLLGRTLGLFEVPLLVQRKTSEVLRIEVERTRRLCWMIGVGRGLDIDIEVGL